MPSWTHTAAEKKAWLEANPMWLDDRSLATSDHRSSTLHQQPDSTVGDEPASTVGEEPDSTVDGKPDGTKSAVGEQRYGDDSTFNAAEGPADRAPSMSGDPSPGHGDAQDKAADAKEGKLRRAKRKVQESGVGKFLKRAMKEVEYVDM